MHGQQNLKLGKVIRGEEWLCYHPPNSGGWKFISECYNYIFLKLPSIRLNKLLVRDKISEYCVLNLCDLGRSKTFKFHSRFIASSNSTSTYLKAFRCINVESDFVIQMDCTEFWSLIRLLIFWCLLKLSNVFRVENEPSCCHVSGSYFSEYSVITKQLSAPKDYIS
jgi:hypothetical protein